MLEVKEENWFLSILEMHLFLDFALNY